MLSESELILKKEENVISWKELFLFIYLFLFFFLLFF